MFIFFLTQHSSKQIHFIIRKHIIPLTVNGKISITLAKFMFTIALLPYMQKLIFVESHRKPWPRWSIYMHTISTLNISLWAHKYLANKLIECVNNQLFFGKHRLLERHILHSVNIEAFILYIHIWMCKRAAVFFVLCANCTLFSVTLTLTIWFMWALLYECIRLKMQQQVLIMRCNIIESLHN